KKCHERALLLVIEAARADFRIEVWIGPATFGVALDDIFKRRQTTVMHVRCGARDLAKCRSLDCAVIPRIAGNREPALIHQTAVAPGDSGIVELLVVKFGPIWQAVQLPFPRNNSSPAFSRAFSEAGRPAA